MSAWKNLYVPDVVLKSLAADGFVTPTPIQALTLPSAIRDRMDIVGAAQTVSLHVAINLRDMQSTETVTGLLGLKTERFIVK